MNKIKYIIPILIWAFLIIKSGYTVLVEERRVYEKYQGMKGTVLWSTFAPRSGIYLCGIRLEDGTYGEVNAGSAPISTGDSFRNHIYYGWIMGISGLAYCILPDEGSYIIWGIVWIMSFWFPLVIFIVSLLIKIYKPRS